MKKPIIGIPSKVQHHKEGDIWRRMEVVDELRYYIIKHGGIAIMLMPSELTYDFNQSDLGDDKILSEEEIEDLHAQVDLCDGIILQGGDYSCSYEVEIARYALEKDIPLMGTCAGFNNILRALGSNIYEDLSKSHSHYDKVYRHDITIEKGTKLHEIIGADEYKVNSLHTMIADKARVEGFAKISAYSYDGLVEAFEVDEKKFVIGVKWHPEIMEGEAYVDRLFEAYIKACKE
ncbi:MAG: gamma-glutamyl-gamma-aminobutyrate hydrolase family protein [Erysipelotrichaceae bacterium]|nr:gamma-glutamyl-gamma-aminobutyrate hydrolase family protein [Erysipelotrichaceae bacterium]